MISSTELEILKYLEDHADLEVAFTALNEGGFVSWEDAKEELREGLN